MTAMPRWSRRQMLGAGLLGFTAAALGLSACDDRKEAANRSGAGEPAPELGAMTLDGETVRLEDLKGRVVLVNFWLAECGPCMAEMPQFEAFYRANRHKGLEILAINAGQPPEVIEAVARRLELSFPLLADPLKITTTRYNVLAYPTSFIIGGDGRLIERINRPLDRDALSAKIRHLL